MYMFLSVALIFSGDKVTCRVKEDRPYIHTRSLLVYKGYIHVYMVVHSHRRDR